MLRTMANIAELIVDGKCGSFFGPWWAPEQPADGSDGEKPGCGMGALSDPDDRGWKAQYYDQNPSYKYVVVRKDFEHPGDRI